MNIRILPFMMILVALLFTNCNKDDELTQEQLLNGVWNLKNVSGGLTGVNVDYNRGLVKWDINLQDSTLVIENNTTVTSIEGIHGGRPSGTYKIKLVGSTLFIDATTKGVLTVVNGKLKIDSEILFNKYVSEFER